MGKTLWTKFLAISTRWSKPDETPEQAMYRELFEEVGLNKQDVRILHSTKHWLKYKLPKRLIRFDSKPVCIGQKQRWFLLQLLTDEQKVNMQSGTSPEFDGWRWVSFWYPVRQVVAFKRDVYRKVMKEFASVLSETATTTLSLAETTSHHNNQQQENAKSFAYRGKKPYKSGHKTGRKYHPNTKR